MAWLRGCSLSQLSIFMLRTAAAHTAQPPNAPRTGSGCGQLCQRVAGLCGAFVASHSLLWSRALLRLMGLFASRIRITRSKQILFYFHRSSFLIASAAKSKIKIVRQ